jgi:hypothetical protein
MMLLVGICLEFGPHITEGCDEAMSAADQRCTCPGCGAVCRGRFQGCQEVWNRGPQPVSLVSKAATLRSIARARSRSGPEARQQPDHPVRLPGNNPLPSANNGPVVSRPEEETAATLAPVVEETLPAGGRRLQEDQELLLRARLDKIERRLDELTAALLEDDSLQDRSTNGQGPGGARRDKPGRAGGRSAS